MEHHGGQYAEEHSDKEGRGGGHKEIDDEDEASLLIVLRNGGGGDNGGAEVPRVDPELVRALVQEQQMAALLVSHQPGDALIASARCAFICDGRVAALADTAQLLAGSEPPQLRAYLGSQ